MSVHLFTGDSIYPLMNSRETTDSLHVYCTWLFRAPKRFSFEAAAAVLHVCATIKLWLEHGLAPRLNWRIYGRALHLVLISPVVKAYHVFPHLLSQANPLFHTPKLAPGGLLHHTPCFSCTAPSIECDPLLCTRPSKWGSKKWPLKARSTDVIMDLNFSLAL